MVYKLVGVGKIEHGEIPDRKGLGVARYVTPESISVICHDDALFGLRADQSFQEE